MIRIIQNCCPWFSCSDPEENQRELVQSTPTGYGLYLGPVDEFHPEIPEKTGDGPLKQEEH